MNTLGFMAYLMHLGEREGHGEVGREAEQLKA